MTQVTKIQQNTFRIKSKSYYFVKPNFLMKDFGELIKAKVKGSTLGWNIEGNWVSYNNLKNAKWQSS